MRTTTTRTTTDLMAIDLTEYRFNSDTPHRQVAGPAKAAS